MATIADLELAVQQRLEETADDVGTFWSVQNEVRAAIVEAMNEATLISGEPQVRADVTTTIPASAAFAPLVLPADAIALLRIEGPGGLPVDKVWMSDLDRQLPGWETATGDVPKLWFPFGLGQFGIYPCLTAPAKVVLNYVQIPVATAPPFDGTETVPFRLEYLDSFKDYAAHVLRLKEGTEEFNASILEYNRFLGKCNELSKFAARKNALRFSKSAGVPAAVNDVRQR